MPREIAPRDGADDETGRRSGQPEIAGQSEFEPLVRDQPSHEAEDGNPQRGHRSHTIRYRGGIGAGYWCDAAGRQFEENDPHRLVKIQVCTGRNQLGVEGVVEARAQNLESGNAARDGDCHALCR